MECEQVIQRLWAHLDRELDEATAREIEAHVRECLHCGPHAEFERRLREAIRTSAQEKAPTTLRERLARLLDQNPEEAR